MANVMRACGTLAQRCRACVQGLWRAATAGGTSDRGSSTTQRHPRCHEAVVSPISAVQPHQRATIVGRVYSFTRCPDGMYPSHTIALLSDGTGSVELNWLGRSSIPGIHVGCSMKVEGILGGDQGSFIIRNPIYFILDEENNDLT